jgi:hypothetical protein
LEDVYRQLFNPELFLLAYGRISRNAGATTPGATAETVDGVNGGRIPGQCGGVKAGQCRQELLLWKGPRSGPFP